MSEWKPIETAPKDGTQILTYAPNTAPSYMVLHYQKSDDPKYTGWWPSAVLWNGDMNGATHWTLLPDPPPVAKGKK